MRAIGLTLVGVAAATVPLAAVWGGLCLALGRAQQGRIDRQQDQAPAAETGTA